MKYPKTGILELPRDGKMVGSGPGYKYPKNQQKETTMTIQEPCPVPNYDWTNVMWLGNSGFIDYYLTKDGNVWNGKRNHWVKTDKYGGCTLMNKRSGKIEHVYTKRLVSDNFTVQDLIKQGFRSLYKGDLYVNSRGDVYSTKDCRYLAHTVGNHGYETVGYNYTCLLVHRLVAEAFVPNPNPALYSYIIHKDNNQLNNNADNLMWCSKRESMRKAASLGAFSSAKLTLADAEHIRELRSSGTSRKEVADMYGVSLRTVDAVYSGQNGDYSADYLSSIDSKISNKQTEVSNRIRVEDVAKRLPVVEKPTASEGTELQEFIKNPSDPKYTADYLRNMRFKEVVPGVLWLHPDGIAYNAVSKIVPRLSYSVRDRRTSLKICGKRYNITRLMADHFVPNDDPTRKTKVAFIDGNRSNVAASNLLWANHTTMAIRRVENGRSGDKLNFDVAKQIRKEYFEDNLTKRDLSEKYKVSGDAIRSILDNISWVR